MKTPKMWRALTTVALTGAAVMATVGPAAADEPPALPCAAGEVYAQISEGVSPSPSTSRLFAIQLRGHQGVRCTISGALDYIRFYDPAGRPLDVRFSDRNAVAPFDNVLVDDFFRAIVYVSAPAGSGGTPIGRMAFSVPTAPESELKAAWPLPPVREPLRISKIMSPVS